MIKGNKKKKSTKKDKPIEVVSNPDLTPKQRKKIKDKVMAEIKQQDTEEDKSIGVIRKKGRPQDFNIKLLRKKYVEYIEICEDSWETLQKSKTRGNTFDADAWEYKLKVKLPSVEGFAGYTGFTTSTFYEWIKKHPLFSDIITDLKERQAEKLLDGGLSGRYNSHIAKLLLIKHGYVEKIESDVDLKGGVNVTFGRPASPFNVSVKNPKTDK